MSTMTRERPIIFSGPMVSAILAGEKSQTRRVVKPQPEVYPGESGLQFEWPNWHGSLGAEKFAHECPYGVPGDQLWVRESAYIAPPHFGEPSDGNATDNQGRRRIVGYAASMDGEAVRCATDYGVKKTPSIHMPRWASRLTLEITEVRVERLQSITEGDAHDEGALGWVSSLDGRAWDLANREWCRWSKRLDPKMGTATARGAFAALWERINGKRPGCSWRDNPWLWVIGFSRVEAS